MGTALTEVAGQKKAAAEIAPQRVFYRNQRRAVKLRAEGLALDCATHQHHRR